MGTSSNISKAQKGLQVPATFMIVFLVIQYALGMVTNLFVQFPDTSQAGPLWEAARSQFPSAAHIVVGTLLLIGAVVFTIRAAGKDNRPWLASALGGLVGIIVAYISGVIFTTLQSDVYSLVMALGFIAAVVAYGWGLLAVKR